MGQVIYTNYIHMMYSWRVSFLRKCWPSLGGNEYLVLVKEKPPERVQEDRLGVRGVKQLLPALSETFTL